jgi:CRP/FNR family transcriptional regulator
MASDKIISISNIKVACGDCSLKSLCLPLGLNREEMHRLDQIIKRPRPLQREQYLYRAGDTFRSIYVVRSGSIKTYTTTKSGDQQITGFHLPGEIVGLDGVSADIYSCNAQSLEMTSICQVPFNRLEELSSSLPGLQHQLHRLMSKELLADHEVLLQLGKMSAEERLAAFLINLSNRSAQRGYSPHEFNISMTRTDIGNYLGLAVETISRQFTHFQEVGLLEAARKHIRILDLPKLRGLAGGEAPCEPNPKAQA